MVLDFLQTLIEQERVVIAERAYPNKDYKYLYPKSEVRRACQKLEDEGFEVEEETDMGEAKSQIVVKLIIPKVLDVKGRILRPINNQGK